MNDKINEKNILTLPRTFPRTYVVLVVESSIIQAESVLGELSFFNRPFSTLLLDFPFNSFTWAVTAFVALAKTPNDIGSLMYVVLIYIFEQTRTVS